MDPSSSETRRAKTNSRIHRNAWEHFHAYEGNVPENQRCAVFFSDRVRVVRQPDNAAASLIVENVNGFVAASIEPSELAAQIVKIDKWLGGTPVAHPPVVSDARTGGEYRSFDRGSSRLIGRSHARPIHLMTEGRVEPDLVKCRRRFGTRPKLPLLQPAM